MSSSSPMHQPQWGGIPGSPPTNRNSNQQQQQQSGTDSSSPYNNKSQSSNQQLQQQQQLAADHQFQQQQQQFQQQSQPVTGGNSNNNMSMNAGDNINQSLGGNRSRRNSYSELATTTTTTGNGGLSATHQSNQERAHAAAEKEENSTKGLLKKYFPTVPITESIIDSFQCSYVAGVHRIGKLYVTGNYVLFWSVMCDPVAIKFSEIASLEKMTNLLVLDGICITLDENVVFGGSNNGSSNDHHHHSPGLNSTPDRFQHGGGSNGNGNPSFDSASAQFLSTPQATLTAFQQQNQQNNSNNNGGSSSSSSPQNNNTGGSSGIGNHQNANASATSAANLSDDLFDRPMRYEFTSFTSRDKAFRIMKQLSTAHSELMKAIGDEVVEGESAIQQKEPSGGITSDGGGVGGADGGGGPTASRTDSSNSTDGSGMEQNRRKSQQNSNDTEDGSSSVEHHEQKKRDSSGATADTSKKSRDVDDEQAEPKKKEKEEKSSKKKDKRDKKEKKAAAAAGSGGAGEDTNNTHKNNSNNSKSTAGAVDESSEKTTTNAVTVPASASSPKKAATKKPPPSRDFKAKLCCNPTEAIPEVASITEIDALYSNKFESQKGLSPIASFVTGKDAATNVLNAKTTPYVFPAGFTIWDIFAIFYDDNSKLFKEFRTWNKESEFNFDMWSPMQKKSGQGGKGATNAGQRALNCSTLVKVFTEAIVPYQEFQRFAIVKLSDRKHPDDVTLVVQGSGQVGKGVPFSDTFRAENLSVYTQTHDGQNQNQPTVKMDAYLHMQWIKFCMVKSKIAKETRTQTENCFDYIPKFIMGVFKNAKSPHKYSKPRYDGKGVPLALPGDDDDGGEAAEDDGEQQNVQAASAEVGAKNADDDVSSQTDNSATQAKTSDETVTATSVVGPADHRVVASSSSAAAAASHVGGVGGSAGESSRIFSLLLSPIYRTRQDESLVGPNLVRVAFCMTLLHFLWCIWKMYTFDVFGSEGGGSTLVRLMSGGASASSSHRMPTAAAAAAAATAQNANSSAADSSSEGGINEQPPAAVVLFFGLLHLLLDHFVRPILCAFLWAAVTALLMSWRTTESTTG